MKGPRLALVWGPEWLMVNSALCTRSERAVKIRPKIPVNAKMSITERKSVSPTLKKVVEVLNL